MRPPSHRVTRRSGELGAGGAAPCCEVEALGIEPDHPPAPGLQAPGNGRFPPGLVLGEAGVARAFMRWLLEPAALGQAMQSLSPAALRAKQERVKKAQYHHNAPRLA
jgi:hypothetical protein